MIVIYISNYVGALQQSWIRTITEMSARLIVTMLSTLPVPQIAATIDICKSAARMRGFETDLHSQGQEFATLLSILYVGYILMQIPS